MFRDTLPSDPDELIRLGYERHEENTSDPCRWVRYRKRIDIPWKELVFDIVIVFELYIDDDPFCSYTENCDYGFPKAELVVWQREEVLLDHNPCEERLVEIGSHDISPTSLKQLEQFAIAIGFKPK